MVKIIDNAKEMGMNIFNNACNSMIDNFRSIKWLYHELEEFKEKISQMENNRNEPSLRSQKNKEDRISLAEKRILNLENYNHNLANQMISILNSINDSIILKARGLLNESEDKDRERAKVEEDVAIEITFSSID